MKLWIPLAATGALGGAALAGSTLATDYSADRTLRIESTVAMETESTTEMERDGEPVDRGFGRGQSTTMTRTVVHFDKVLEHADGRPTKVERTFDDVSIAGVASFGENERELDRQSPLSAVTLELTLEDGEVEVEVTDGTEPDAEQALQGHRLELALDALLPDGEVEADSSWELDGEQVARALGADLERALFPPVPREGGEGRGGRGGGRGGRGMRGGGGNNLGGMFAEAEWDAKATVVSLEADHDGALCVEVELELEGEGELPEQEFGGGRGGRGGGGRLSAPELADAALRAVENSFSIELEGRMLFSVEEKRPVLLEVEGQISSDSIREFERENTSMVISTSRETAYEQTITISEESDE